MTALDKKTFVFVVGAPRSGTTWLHRMLGECHQVTALERELSFLKYLGDWAKRYEREKSWLSEGISRHGIPLDYPPDEFYGALRTLADMAYAKAFRQGMHGTHIADKHPGYSFHIKLIERLYPGSKFVHIIRDGREVVVSMMSAKRRIGFGAGEIKGATRDWTRHLSAAREAGVQLGPRQYLEVRYEKLMSNTTYELGEIFKFCGIGVDEGELSRIAVANAIGKKQVSRGDQKLNALRITPDAIWKNKLSLEERWTMDRMAGHLLQELGYASPGWWALGIRDRISMGVRPALKRILNTLGSAKHTWNTPVASR